MMRLLKDQRGYSMIELIGAMTIFGIISIAIVGALISVMQSSTKTGAERRTQQDARYSVEEMARQTRSSSIDYAFYANNASQADCAFGTGANSNANKVLALVFTESDEANAPVSKRLIFFQKDGAVYRYEANVGTVTPDCETIKSNGTKISSENVTVPTLTFYISPNQDPYAQEACPVGNENACLVARNTHPRVTMLMTVEVEGKGSGTSKESGTGVTTIQTTVNSRVYQTKKLAGS